MRLLSLELGPFEARCVVIAGEPSGEAAIVDPGFEPETVIETVRREGLHPVAVVLTHAHLDHAWGVAAVKAEFPAAPLLLHAADLPLYRNLPGQAQAFGFPVPEVPSHDGTLEDGGEIRVGEDRWLVRHCPGHSPGHIVLVHGLPGQPTAVVGDVLFAGSVGRTDLWGGSFEQLERSIRDVLYRLPDTTRVVPGHGPETTIGAERTGNPFVSG